MPYAIIERQGNWCVEMALPAFTRSQLPEAAPLPGEAVIIISSVSMTEEVALPEAELQRAKKISHQPSRQRYLAGRYLLRGVLSGWLSVKPQDLEIVLSPTGKPFLKGGEIEFSISHADHLVAGVFTRSIKGEAHANEVGIDLEQERPVDIAALADRFFSAEEARMVKESHSIGDFFRLWCCREAAIKADGRGLGVLLSMTKVVPSLREKEGALDVIIEDALWEVTSWKLQDDIHGAVAFRHRPSVIHWCELRDQLE